MQKREDMEFGNMRITPSNPHAGDRSELAQRVNELYHDLQAGEFDAIHARRHAVESLFWTEQVVPRLSGSGVGLGVDLCTGTGFVPRVLLSRLPQETRMICIDVSTEALARAHTSLKRWADQIDFRLGSVDAVPLGAGTAHWVSLNAGLHHIPDPGGVLAEVDRILKPGGYFFLGYEPNALFFSSPIAHGIERAVWHLFWYLSPQRNWRRLRRAFGRDRSGLSTTDHIAAINDVLMSEKLVTRPLSLMELRQLVDVHAHGEHGRNVGFIPSQVVQQHFHCYNVEAVSCCDYGGEMLRAHPGMRRCFDSFLRILLPKKGMLFSLIVRKPSNDVHKHI